MTFRTSQKQNGPGVAAGAVSFRRRYYAAFRFVAALLPRSTVTS
jgi:hypothetical protein